LSWQKVSFDFGDNASVSASRNAWHGFWGVVLGLMVIALILLVGARMAKVALPEAIPYGRLVLGLAALILLFAVLKNLFDDFSAWGSYLGIALAAAVVLGAWRHFAETGETLPAQVASALRQDPAEAQGED